MDHHQHLILLLTLLSSLILLSLATVILVFFNLYRRYRIPLCADCRDSSDDLELGPADARVADGPEDKPDKKPEPAELAARRFGWAELETLTAGFAADVIVGEGGFSTVYFARLTDGGSAAVKLHRPSERLHRAFRQELDVLLALRHPYIVRLLGYCDDREEGALVFEYVPEGSLHERLHGSSAAVLPWGRRMAVAHQLALALDYLHDGCDPQVIHGDIKAANVLLDDDLNAKLIDFGFARKGFSAAVGLGRSTMFGSPGYVDPHYLRSGLVSKKSDVYSYGVLLLELVTGMEAFNSEKEERLTTAVRPLLRGNEVGELVDARLGGSYDVEEAAEVLAVAVMCVGDIPGLRPGMGEVARIIGEKARGSILAVGGRSDGGKSLM